ncbi:unnamed protein product [Pieris brassicae]|uniref:Glucuronosyltransferase n=1 Tax=Pieris brassicae TaxID=7116 RepID=A0A9P0WXH2_PIEBR|nr:unnamed protein product [Pieris brassicae]
MRPIIHNILTLITCLYHVEGATILALFPHPGKSHHMVFEPLFLKLAQRGHQMTVASFFPLENPPANYTELSFVGLAGLGLEVLDMAMYENPPLKYGIPLIGDIMKQRDEVRPLARSAVTICEKLMGWKPLIEVLKQDYDLVIVENFNSDCMLGLLHLYGIKAPVIALSSSNAFPSSAERLGFVDNPSYVPIITSPWTIPMSYIQRVKNAVLNVYFKSILQNIQDTEKAIIEKHYGKEVPLYDLSKNIGLLMLNTFHELNGVRPLVPGLLEVGGMHLDREGKEIPQVS